MPLDGPAQPRPKAASLARGERRYRRKIASPKQWQAILSAKVGPCRVCGAAAWNGSAFPKVQMHHVVTRQDGGDDLPDNIVPLCLADHDAVTRRVPQACYALLVSLTDAEYAYMIERGGENYAERGYGVEYQR